MKKNILIVAIVSLFLGCTHDGQPRVYEDRLSNWQNQNLVRWFRNTFAPQTKSLEIDMRRGIDIHIVENDKFVGTKTNSYRSVKTLNEEKQTLQLLHDEPLRLYKNYIQSVNGTVIEYKSFLTKRVVSKLNMLKKDGLKGCNYNNMFLAKISNKLHSSFIDVSCLYSVQDIFNPKDIEFLRKKKLNSAISHKETEGYIGIISAEETKKILDTLPNSILKEAIILY